MTDLVSAGSRMKSCALRANRQGIFEGYASVFNTIDSGGDIVIPGAFSASLAKRKPAGIRMLFQHDPAQPVGVWLAIKQDSYGLYVRGKLTLEVARANELSGLLAAGAIDGLSIGFKTINAHRDRSSGARRLTKVDLWEISLVTFPMLASARVSSLKSHHGAASVRRGPIAPDAFF